MSAAPLAPPETMRARRAPLAVLGYYVFQLAAGLVIAAPVHAWAHRTWGTHPDGDLALWRAGGLELLAWIGDEGPARAVAARTSFALLALATVVALLPLGALLASLVFGRADDDPRALRGAPAYGVAARAFVPLGSLQIVVGVLQIAVAGTVAFGAASLGRALEPHLGDLPAFEVRLVVTVFGVLLALALGAVADVARAATVIDVGTSPGRADTVGVVRRALVAILRVPRRDLARGLGAWALRGLGAIALVVVGAKLTDAIALRSVALTWAVHQIVVLARVGLRASWLARAARLAARAAEPSSDQAERPRAL